MAIGPVRRNLEVISPPAAGVRSIRGAMCGLLIEGGKADGPAPVTAGVPEFRHAARYLAIAGTNRVKSRTLEAPPRRIKRDRRQTQRSLRCHTRAPKQSRRVRTSPTPPSTTARSRSAQRTRRTNRELRLARPTRAGRSLLLQRGDEIESGNADETPAQRSHDEQRRRDSVSCRMCHSFFRRGSPRHPLSTIR
jgi:hypothetical protein